MCIHEQYFAVLPIRCHMNSKDSGSWTSGKCAIMQLMHISQLIGMCLCVAFVHWLTQTDICRKLPRLWLWAFYLHGRWNVLALIQRSYHTMCAPPLSRTISRQNSCLLYAIISMFVAKSRYGCKTYFNAIYLYSMHVHADRVPNIAIRYTVNLYFHTNCKVHVII